MNAPSQDQALPRLVVDSPDRIRGQIHVLDFEPLLVGRDSACQIQLLHPQISRRHALVRSAEGHTTVEDLASTNGTRLNGHLVLGQQILHDGDVLDFGPLEVHYEEPIEEAATTVAEPPAHLAALRAETVVIGGAGPPRPLQEDAEPAAPPTQVLLERPSARPVSVRDATAEETSTQEEAEDEAQEEAATEEDTTPDAPTEETPGPAPEDSGWQTAAQRMAARPTEPGPVGPGTTEPGPPGPRPTEPQETPRWGPPAHAVPPQPSVPPAVGPPTFAAPTFGPPTFGSASAGPHPEHTSPPQPHVPPPGSTPPATTPRPGTERRFDVAEQRAAGNLSNIGGNQYNYLQQDNRILLARRKAYFRKLKATWNTARRLALVGLLLTVVGFAFRAWLDSGQDTLDSEVGGVAVDMIGLAVGMTGIVLLVVGAVLAATTVFRRRRYEREEERRLNPNRSPSR
ncbi:FHA domain-containing protein [Kitasatospora sp. NPDC054939]